MPVSPTPNLLVAEKFQYKSTFYEAAKRLNSSINFTKLFFSLCKFNGNLFTMTAKVEMKSLTVTKINFLHTTTLFSRVTFK